MKVKETQPIPIDMNAYRLQLAQNLRDNPANPEALKAYASYIKQHVIPEMIAEAQPYSFQEYFAMTLSQGVRALEEGSYGVGAVYVYRANGVEIILGGRQASVSKRNTHLHAEEMVIDEIEALSRGERVEKENVLAIRNAPHDKEEKLLICSLEPCIGCYRRLTTHNPDSVWIATTDANGAMLDGRQEVLPGIWSTRSQKRGIQVVTPSDDPNSLTYINPLYRDIAVEMFESTQKHVDDVIKGIHAEPKQIIRKARQSRRKIFRKVF